MELIAYEMKYTNAVVGQTIIDCIPFEKKYFQEYMKIYNECFYEMRKALEIQPYHFLSDYEQIKEKAEDIYLLLDGDKLIGAIACYGNEVDDLIVNKRFQQKGYGKQLLLWGMQYIRKKNKEPITLHVAAWNENALKLYQKIGFEISRVEKIR